MMTNEKQSLYDLLLLRISNQNKTALGELYIQLKDPVYSLALAIVKNRNDAADIMQEAFIHVWQYSSQYHPGTNVRAWILKITRNLALQSYKKERKFVDLDTYEEKLTVDSKESEICNDIVLEKILNELNLCERQIVVLYSLCEYTHKEIASIMGIPYATVRWKFSNAMKKLSALIEEEQYEI